MSSEKKPNISRRRFGKGLVAASTLPFACNFIPAHAMGKLEKPALVGIGAGGKGQTDLKKSVDAGMNVVGLVDTVDATKLGNTSERRLRSMGQVRDAYPDARYFSDYREMFAAMGDKFDAVTVSTPDHHHFHASSMAMKMGKHVYCQKPLTRTISESRALAKLAQETGVQTQMGNQAHANNHMRRCIELIRSGIVGKIQEIHAWTNRPIWPQGFAEAPPVSQVPAWLNWQQWIGPSAWVDYSPYIAPFNWRGWWNYGAGALGDMACHIMDMGFWAMQPAPPTSVFAEQVGATSLSAPINSKVTWQFPANEYSSKSGFQYFWYDGFIDARFERDGWRLIKNGDEYNHPADSVMEGLSFEEYNTVVVGEKGKLYFNQGKDNWLVKPSTILDGFSWPEISLPRAPGQDNYQEWVDAIHGRLPHGESHFAYAGPFTETILLGVLAQRFPNEKHQWDADNMRIVGRDDLTSFIAPEYRSGWIPTA
ncbi:MAG: Gfo/Idh/MocA family oxidoreductase [Planctomycetales bacterium]|nr:Gfo/Idh/MocA family oxidoreductase [Planctomycetales bacterium]